jgi:hypothetical protein
VSLQSIVIPASVTTISGRAFARCRIQTIDTEKGNGTYVFTGCLSLGNLVGRASVRKIDFEYTGIDPIEAAGDNPSFRTDGYFLLCSAGALVRFFGRQLTVTLSPEPLVLHRCYFSGCYRLEKWLFESKSALTELGEFVFWRCQNLELIDLPASLENIRASTDRCTIGVVAISNTTSSDSVNP